jgi:hypothetical protein
MCASLVLLLVGASSPEPTPSLEDLPSGPYSRMHMLLEKTIFKVDVAIIDVAVDQHTRDRLAQTATGRAYSPSLEAELARLALAADNAVVRMKFVRHVSLEQWIDGVRESIDQAKAAGLATPKLAKAVGAGLPGWFREVGPRGFQVGDAVVYRVQPNRLRSLVVRADGTVVVDRTDEGADKGDLVLGTYFARGTPYRTPLLQSLH